MSKMSFEVATKTPAPVRTVGRTSAHGDVEQQMSRVVGDQFAPRISGPFRRTKLECGFDLAFCGDEEESLKAILGATLDTTKPNWLGSFPFTNVQDMMTMRSMGQRSECRVLSRRADGRLSFLFVEFTGGLR